MSFKWSKKFDRSNWRRLLAKSLLLLVLPDFYTSAIRAHNIVYIQPKLVVFKLFVQSLISISVWEIYLCMTSPWGSHSWVGILGAYDSDGCNENSSILFFGRDQIKLHTLLLISLHLGCDMWTNLARRPQKQLVNK